MQMDQIQSELDGRGDRVREHTPQLVTRRIDDLTRSTVDQAIRQGREAVTHRLDELDHEWDVDRALMVHFAVLGGATFLAGVLRTPRRRVFGRSPSGLLYLFATQLGFLFMHGVVGWCPPASLFRRLGFRTSREIETERRVLDNALASTELAVGH
jgi:hypothetical protein